MDYISIIIFLLLALVVITIKSPWFKGVVGETTIKYSAKFQLPENIYHPIHNVTLPALDGTTQIDHIFVSQFGIFVVETKNMKGWIFGGEKQKQWTQTIYKKTYKFQNPLHQNYKHVKALETALNVPSEIIHSVVVFAGDSTFKTPMPANVFNGGGYSKYIKSFSEPVLSDTEVNEVVSQIQSGRLVPSRKTNRNHVQQLKARSNPNSEQVCPKCGSSMVLRTAKKGANAGNQFWGCSEYPKCRMVKKVT